MREFDSSYVLRVWKDGKGADAWRASLKELKSQEIQLFSSLEALTRFFNQTISQEKENVES